MIREMKIEVSKTLFTQEGSRRLEFDLQIKAGELVGIFGASGSGKTTLLRMIAGLAAPDEGSIVVDGCTWFDSIRHINLSAESRCVGFVFQDHNLFPNMTVEGNLRFSLRHGFPDIIEEVLQVLGLSELRARKPSQLSGGQSQRVALARTLVNQPHLLLLDEPFSSLDWSLRWRLQNDLLDWHRRFGCTTLLVSHDLLELTRITSRIIHLGETVLNADELDEAAVLYAKMSQNIRSQEHSFSYSGVGKSKDLTYS